MCSQTGQGTDRHVQVPCACIGFAHKELRELAAAVRWGARARVAGRWTAQKAALTAFA